MTTPRIVAGLLAVVMTVGSAPALAQQAMGAIGGKAADEAKKPYSDYVVQLRDVTSGQVVSTKPLDPQGQFGFTQRPAAGDVPGGTGAGPGEEDRVHRGAVRADRRRRPASSM